jgi:hypothetical protein
MWILEQLIEAPGSLTKSEVREKYSAYCKTVKAKAVNDSRFGILFSQCYPEVKTKRLGGRNNLKYTYIGLQWRDDNVTTPSPEDFGSELARLKANNPTLKHCPKGARQELARALTEALKDVVKFNSEEHWKRLFLLPYATISVPDESEKVTNLTTWVKSKIFFLGSEPLLHFFATASTSSLFQSLQIQCANI